MLLLVFVISGCYNNNTIKLILKLTLLNLKPQKKNHVIIYSNILIVKVTTKQIATTILSRSIGLTETNITRNHRNSKKSELIQFAQV